MHVRIVARSPFPAARTGPRPVNRGAPGFVFTRVIYGLADVRVH
jgi:hypothetical protein